MAWRHCIVPGCAKRKPIQPFGTTTVHKWLCPKHRAQMQEERIDKLAKIAKARRSLAAILTGRSA